MFLLSRHTPRSVVHYVLPLHFWIREFWTRIWAFFLTKSVPEYGTERYTKGLLNFLYIFFLAHRTSSHNLCDLCTLSSSGWEEVLETLTILLVWGRYYIWMQLHYTSFLWFLLLYVHFRGDVKNCSFSNLESKRCQKLWFWCIFEFSMYAALLIIFAFADVYKDLQL